MNRRPLDVENHRQAPVPRLLSKTTNMAFRSPGAVVLFVITAAGSLAGDLASKHYVFKSMLAEPAVEADIRAICRQYGNALPARAVLDRLHPQRQVLPGVKFTLSVNPGGVFGLGLPRSVMAIAAAATMVFVCVLFATAAKKAFLLHIAMAFILAGAVGNFYDRVFASVELPGLEPIRYHVRDFIDCGRIGWPWVYNVADVLLVIGAGLIVIQWFFVNARKKQAVTGRE